jgi:hypothetical protein
MGSGKGKANRARAERLTGVKAVGLEKDLAAELGVGERADEQGLLFHRSDLEAAIESADKEDHPDYRITWVELKEVIEELGLWDTSNGFEDDFQYGIRVGLKLAELKSADGPSSAN